MGQTIKIEVPDGYELQWNDKIKVPDGYELQWNDDHTEVKVVKKKELTYKDICEKLFRVDVYWTTQNAKIDYCSNVDSVNKYELNNATSELQLQKMLAYNKLMNIAEYLNEEWKPNWEDTRQTKYYIVYSNENIKGKYRVFNTGCYNQGVVYFKFQELAEQAIQIMGEDLDILFKN